MIGDYLMAKERFWPVPFGGGQLRLQGRHEDAVQMFERRLDIRNDPGLLSEEYDPIEKRQVGNFPQAFSHVGMVNTAFNLSSGSGQPPAAATRCGGFSVSLRIYG